MFERLLQKFSKRKEENYALASLLGVYINPPNETEWTQALDKCVVSFGKNASGVFVIRILQPIMDGRDKSLYRFPVYNNFDYDVQSPTWHSWCHNGVYYGLEFVDPAEAVQFEQAIERYKMLAPAPPPKHTKPVTAPITDQEKVELQQTAQKHGLPSDADAIKVYARAGIKHQDLEDESLRKEVVDELDNLETASIMAEDKDGEHEDFLKQAQQDKDPKTVNVKPRPLRDDSGEQLKAEVERLRKALTESQKQLARTRHNLAREVQRKRQFRALLVKNKISIPPPPNRPRRPAVKQNKREEKWQKLSQDEKSSLISSLKGLNGPTQQPQRSPSPGRKLPAAPTAPTAPTDSQLPPIPPKPEDLGHHSNNPTLSAAALQGVQLHHSEVKEEEIPAHPPSFLSADALKSVKLHKGRKHPERWAMPKEPSKQEMYGDLIAKRLWARRMAMSGEANNDDDSDSWED